MYQVDTGLEEVSIPDGVRELCDYCFAGRFSPRRVMFGSLLSLERIRVYCFKGHGVKEVIIPSGGCELFDGCFNRERMGCNV